MCICPGKVAFPHLYDTAQLQSTSKMMDLQNELLLEYLANKKLMLQLQNNTNSLNTSTAFRSLRMDARTFLQ